MLEQITPLIITFDEAPNIRRVLEKLVWARRIVVMDSGSTDGTLDILKSFPQVDVINRPFDDFANQCNFGLIQIETTWVLSLDADYELSDKLVAELNTLKPSEEPAGYRANFVYRIYGRPLRGTLYPPRVVLYQKEKAHYQSEGHGHRVTVDGEIGRLSGVIYHDDRKCLGRWISSQVKYARVEADYLFEKKNNLSTIDRLRARGWPAPFLIVIYTLFVKGCIFDGWPGWHYTLQRLIFEVLTAIEVVDRRLRAIKSPATNVNRCQTTRNLGDI
jgi:glycosyltransferase involved in cell wall biosynthesis